MTRYLEKSALFPPQIQNPPNDDLGMVVVIPAYREDQLIKSLQSLKDCQSPTGAVEVIVLINDSEKEEEATFKFHQKKYEETLKWAEENSKERLHFHILYHSRLPARHAGVGLARKIGMDEAVYRLESAGHPEGILFCYDADSTCLPNYLRAVEKYFFQNPKSPAASIHFEHPISGEEFDAAIYEAIVEYELHLRYYLEMQRRAGFPLAFHTVGSSMAVRANAYQAQGGMNRRKAGEDFYFLHKFTTHPNFGEINTTTVIPSPRKSDRVPFGTGKSVQEILGSDQAYLTYAPATFVDLKYFLEKIQACFSSNLDLIWLSFPQSIQAYFPQSDFKTKCLEIRSNTTSQKQFIKRFFHWFNAFQLMKFVHFARDHFYPNVSVNEAGNYLLGSTRNLLSNEECLLKLRKMQLVN